MKRCRYILNIVVLLAGLSCSKEAELSEDRMQFNPSLPFSSTKASDTAFEPSDAIGIYVVDESAGDSMSIPTILTAGRSIQWKISASRSNLTSGVTDTH